MYFVLSSRPRPGRDLSPPSIKIQLSQHHPVAKIDSSFVRVTGLERVSHYNSNTCILYCHPDPKQGSIFSIIIVGADFLNQRDVKEYKRFVFCIVIQIPSREGSISPSIKIQRSQHDPVAKIDSSFVRVTGRESVSHYNSNACILYCHPDPKEGSISSIIILVLTF